MSRILVSGSIAYDRIMEFGGQFKEHLLPENLDHLSVSFTVDTFAEGFGGTAGNIAYNLSLLGHAPAIIAMAGKDFAAYGEWMTQCGIDPSSIGVIDDIATAGGYMITDTKNNQIAAFYIGAMAHPYRPEILMAGTALAIIAPGNTDDMTSLARSYRTLGIRYLYDPGQQSIRLTPDDFKEGIEGAEILFANEYEMQIIAERTGWSIADIRSKVPTVVTTLGEKGSHIAQDGTEIIVPSVPVANVVDPTGAGDAYRAGFIMGILANLPLETSARIASTVASFAVEKNGTQNHRFTLDELKIRYENAYHEPLEA